MSLARRLGAFWLGQADLAPLGLFRIVFGLLLVNWFWQLGPDLGEFFTDEGLLPRSSALASFGDRFSLLHLFGQWWQVALFYAAAVASALLLAIGYRTRIAAVLAFVAVISFQDRNPLILDGSDLVYRLTAFWLIFTAAGDRYSVDALLKRSRGEAVPPTGWALPIRILQLQIAWVYLATGLEKLGGTYWLDGTAVYYALQLQHTFGRSYAYFLTQVPELVRLASWGTLAVELFFLPLVFFPILQPLLRLVAVAAAASLHLGIALFMNVGNFPIVMLAALILFLPAQWVERVAGAAWIRIGPALARLWQWARREVPELERLPPPAPAAAPDPGQRAAAAVLLAFVAVMSFGTAMPTPVGEPTREPIAGALRYAALDQRWNMFSPDPARSDGWTSARGLLDDGTPVELIGHNGRPIPGDPIVLSSLEDPVDPRFADPLYNRWSKVYERVANVDYRGYRLEFGRMFCRMRNLHVPEGVARLERFEVSYSERVIQPPGGGPPEVRRHDIWSHVC